MKFRLTTKYGELDALHLRPHSGCDLAMDEGTVLRSVTEGTVKLADYGNQNAGKTVMIDSPDGHTYIYGHLHDFVAKNGQHVKPGDVIGHAGNSGNSFGSHLHFGMKDTATGHFQDPSSLVEKVSNYAGAVPLIPDPLHVAGAIPQLFGMGGEALKESAKEATINILMGVGEALGETIAGISLIGVGLCVILKICGWSDGGKWAGVLIGVNILMKFLGVKG